MSLRFAEIFKGLSRNLWSTKLGKPVGDFTMTPTSGWLRRLPPTRRRRGPAIGVGKNAQFVEFARKPVPFGLGGRAQTLHDVEVTDDGEHLLARADTGRDVPLDELTPLKRGAGISRL